MVHPTRTAYGTHNPYGTPMLAISGLLTGASGLASAITSPLTAKQERMAAEAAAKGAGYQAQAQAQMAQAQLQQAAGAQAGQTQRFALGLGGISLIAILGLAAYFLTRK